MQDRNKSSQKGRIGKKKVAEYIRTHVACIEQCITSWQSQDVSGSQSVRERERHRERESAVSRSQNVRERVTASPKYTWLTLVT